MACHCASHHGMLCRCVARFARATLRCRRRCRRMLALDSAPKRPGLQCERLADGVSRLERDQPVELGADIGHAAGNHDAARCRPVVARRPCAPRAEAAQWALPDCAWLPARPRTARANPDIAQARRRDCDANCAPASSGWPAIARGEQISDAEKSDSHVNSKGQRLNTGRIAFDGPRQGDGSAPYARHLSRPGDSRPYISMVLRIRPTARPSISKGSPGCDDDGGVVGVFRVQLDDLLVALEALDRDFVAQSRHDDLAVRASLVACTASRSPSMMPASRIDMPRTLSR